MTSILSKILTNEQKAELLVEKLVFELERLGVKIEGRHMTLIAQFKDLIIRCADDVLAKKLTKEQFQNVAAKATEKVAEVIIRDTCVM